MIATIKPYDSGVNKGYIIECRDNDGKIVERITATDVIITGEPWPQFVLDPGNRIRLI